MSDDKNSYTAKEKKLLLEGSFFLHRPGEAMKLAKDIYDDRKATWALCDYLTAQTMYKREIDEEIVLPDWVLNGILEKLMDHMLLELTVSKGEGPTSSALAKQTKDRVHALRYLTVMKLRDDGLSLENACEAVADGTADHPWEAKPVKSGAIRKSYKAVRKDIMDGGTRFYLPTMRKVRNALLGHLKLFGVIKS